MSIHQDNLRSVQLVQTSGKIVQTVKDIDLIIRNNGNEFLNNLDPIFLADLQRSHEVMEHIKGALQRQKNIRDQRIDIIEAQSFNKGDMVKITKFPPGWKSVHGILFTGMVDSINKTSHEDVNGMAPGKVNVVFKTQRYNSRLDRHEITHFNILFNASHLDHIPRHELVSAQEQFRTGGLYPEAQDSD